MTKLIRALLFVSIVFFLSSCTTDEIELDPEPEPETEPDPEPEPETERSLSDYDWYNKCKTFTGYQFKDGKEIFIIYNDLNILFNCYNNKGNVLWEKEVSNIKVNDFYDDGLLLENPLTKINLEGNNVWLIETPIKNIIEGNDGVKIIYSIKDNIIGNESIIKLDNNGNIEWENKSYSFITNLEVVGNKIIFEFKNDKKLLAILDYAGNELITFEVNGDYKYFVTEDSIYFYNILTDTLYKYDFLKNVIYTLNNIVFDNFLFEFDDAIIVSSEDKITKINNDGTIVFEITDPSNYLSDYQFHTSFEDGSFIVSSKSTTGEIAYYKYSKDSNLIFQKSISKELNYIKTFSNGNMLFEYNDLLIGKKSFLIFDSNLNLLYTSDNYSLLNSSTLITNNLKYDYIKDKNKGCVIFKDDGSFYISKRNSNKDQLYYVDIQGNENFMFDIYSYKENALRGDVESIFLVENKFLFTILDETKIKLLLTDNDGNVEAFGDYFGLIKNKNERTYFIKNNDEIKEFTVPIPN